jgi:UDP-N-acetylmuramyl pentapeptide phosphotransferase/UDP-N-acetylglucosamine-1-phosphate transferase
MNLSTPLAAQAAVAAVAFGLTALLAEVVRRVALRCGLVDRSAARRAHQPPTPYLGGAAIALGALAPAMIAIRGHDTALWTVAGAALAVVVLGIADDLRGLRAEPRLAAEVLLAGVVVAAGGRLHVAGPAWLDMALTVCWIVLLANSFSLLDKVDGALATVACVTALPLAVLLALGGQPYLGGLLVCLSAACGGYLVHSLPPARIAMGGGGSRFVGMTIAASTTWLPAKHDRYGHVAVLLLLTFPAVVDTTLVVASRCLRGRPPWRGGTDHLAHRLRQAGLGGNGVLAVLLLVTAASGLFASFVSGGLLSGPFVLPALGLAAMLLVGLLLPTPGNPAGTDPRPAAAAPAVNASTLDCGGGTPRPTHCGPTPAAGSPSTTSGEQRR